jgi:hypothetical protein
MKLQGIFIEGVELERIVNVGVELQWIVRAW